MSIKRRLFFSNVLMIVIPVVTTIFSAYLFLAILNVVLHGELFALFEAKMEAQRLQDAQDIGADFGFQMVSMASLGAAWLFASIYFTNRFLTRFILKRIEQPLDMLSVGVHQIKDGNLNYRIQYGTEDEFKPICEDFNEMALRLSEMVSARQKDETNRRELIAGISHDLRTPLTSVKAYLEGLEKGVATTPEAQKRYFDTIRRKTNDLEYIINQLFLYSKLELGDFPFHIEDTDIAQELCHFAANHQKEYDEKGLSISLKQTVENVMVEVDVVQFRNVIYNILENSAKYKNNEHAEIEIACRESGNDVVITLADNGPGVPEEALEKLFDVFYRSDTSRKDVGKGSGLGLAISKQIVERLGGRISADKNPGGGLAVKIVLPKRGGRLKCIKS